MLFVQVFSQIFNFLPFEFIFHSFTPSSSHPVSTLSQFDQFCSLDQYWLMSLVWRKEREKKKCTMPCIRKMRTSICLFLFIIISREYVVVVRRCRSCFFLLSSRIHCVGVQLCTDDTSGTTCACRWQGSENDKIDFFTMHAVAAGRRPLVSVETAEKRMMGKVL